MAQDDKDNEIPVMAFNRSFSEAPSNAVAADLLRMCFVDDREATCGYVRDWNKLRRVFPSWQPKLRMEPDWTVGNTLPRAKLNETDTEGKGDPINLCDVVFKSVDFSGCRLNGATFDRTHFGQVCFTGTDADGCTFEKAEFPLEAKCDGSFKGCNFSGAILSGCRFSGAKCSDAKFNRAEITDTNFIDANLKSSDFSHTQGKNTRFDKADLPCAEFHDAELNSANFEGADCTSVNFRSTRLNDASFEGGAMLVDANFDFTIIIRARFGNAQMNNAHGEQTVMHYCKFDTTNLANVKFSRTDFTESVFYHVNLEGARFNKCDFKLSTISHIKYCKGLKFYLCQNLYGDSKAIISDEPQEIREARFFCPGSWRQLPLVKHIAEAKWLKEKDYTNWAYLRSIGTLRIFGASYLALIAIITYVSFASRINRAILMLKDRVETLTKEHDWSWINWVSSIHPLNMTWVLAAQLAAIFLLAIGATVFLFCPTIVREYSEASWTLEHNNSVIEYHAAMYSRPLFRKLCAWCYVLGGGFTLIHLIYRSLMAFMVLINANL